MDKFGKAPGLKKFMIKLGILGAVNFLKIYWIKYPSISHTLKRHFQDWHYSLLVLPNLTYNG